jgi:hypothetical protein
MSGERTVTDRMSNDRHNLTRAVQRGTRGGGFCLLLVGVLLLPAGLSGAQSTNAPGQLSFDSFRVISDRNIFNPNRTVRGATRAPTPTRTAARPVARVEAISLVGIMAYEKGYFAFFDGSGGDYAKVLQTGGRIGEYTVTQVTTTNVKLATGTNVVDLKVGMQLRREDEGDWFLGETSDAPRRRVVASTRTTNPRTRTITRGAGASGPAGGLGDLEPEILVIDSREFELENGVNDSAALNGALPANGRVAPPEPDLNGVTDDPVILRMMQRRQELEQ